MKKVVFIGAGGHCKNILAFFRFNREYSIHGITDMERTGAIYDIPILGTDAILADLLTHEGVQFAFIGVGSVGDSSIRARLYDRVSEAGFTLLNILHPASIVSEDVHMGSGNLILAGSIINAGVSLGDNCIINTGAIIEHDIRLGNHVHIAPGAVLGGAVEVGDLSHVGIGATVLQGVKIGTNALIGAGAVVIEDVPDHAVVVGVPAKVIKLKREGQKDD